MRASTIIFAVAAMVAGVSAMSSHSPTISTAPTTTLTHQPSGTGHPVSSGNGTGNPLPTGNGTATNGTTPQPTSEGAGASFGPAGIFGSAIVVGGAIFAANAIF